MWQAFVQWFTDVIHFFYGITVSLGVPNYGLAIILLTIVIKLILFPLTQKQMKSMRATQSLQPKIKYLQDKYKDDAQVMQTKVMELYKEHGVNPFGGCLPLLIQMPIFIAFFQSLLNFVFIEEAHAGFLWIPNIGASDPYYLLSILAAVTTYLQQRVSMVDTKDPTQKTLLYIMPLFMAWIAATMPAGLPLYWIMFNILGIAQQLYVNKISDKATNVRLSTPTGVSIDIDAQVIDKDTVDNDSEPKGTGREKGGNNNGSSNRKKRKKR